MDLSCCVSASHVCVCLRGCAHIWPFLFQVQSECWVLQKDSDRLPLAVDHTGLLLCEIGEVDFLPVLFCEVKSCTNLQVRQSDKLQHILTAFF